MAKEKEIKHCKTDCIEYLNGHCMLKMKDGIPSDASVAVIGKDCSYYRKVKTLFSEGK